MTEHDVMEFLRCEAPISLETIRLTDNAAGLLVIDLINAFCTAGSGPLAPPYDDAAPSIAVHHGAKLAQKFIRRRWPILLVGDEHEPGTWEFQYPPHAARGSRESNFVKEFTPFVQYERATVLKKDCIDAVTAAWRGGHNLVYDWINEYLLSTLVVIGDCTDICLLAAVSSLCSAMQLGSLPVLDRLVVYVPATFTYDLPVDVARANGLFASAAHPRAVMEHAGLRLMKGFGAILADKLVW